MQWLTRVGEEQGQVVEKRSHENAGEKVLCVAAGAVALAGWLAGWLARAAFIAAHSSKRCARQLLLRLLRTFIGIGFTAGGLAG